jgi:uncharacterized membrane protein
MPFWMGSTLLIHLVILGLTWHWPTSHSAWLLVATVLWIGIILFSVLGPVPINNQVKVWDLSSLPNDWQEQRRRWDRLNAFRVVLILGAFVALLLSYKELI